MNNRLISTLCRFKKYKHKDPLVRCRSVFAIYPPPGDNLEIPGELIRLDCKNIC